MRRCEFESGIRLGSLCDFAGFDTSRADLHSAGATLRQLNAYRLQIWIKPARSPVICVRHVISELGAFAANFATFCHYFAPLKLVRISRRKVPASNSSELLRHRNRVL